VIGRRTQQASFAPLKKSSMHHAMTTTRSTGRSSFGGIQTIHHSNSLGSQDSSNGSVSNSSGDSLLTVFQADPLAYTDDDANLIAVPVLDFESERQLLTESLINETDGNPTIDVLFDIATTERLGTFLAKGEGRVLHFSCHGHPEYLAIENGWVRTL
jgi:hypothetical protein